MTRLATLSDLPSLIDICVDSILTLPPRLFFSKVTDSDYRQYMHGIILRWLKDQTFRVWVAMDGRGEIKGFVAWQRIGMRLEERVGNEAELPPLPELPEGFNLKTFETRCAQRKVWEEETMEEFGPHIFAHMLAVMRDSQKSGIATSLCDRVIEDCNATGLQCFLTCTIYSLGFYQIWSEKKGFILQYFRDNCVLQEQDQKVRMYLLTFVEGRPQTLGRRWREFGYTSGLSDGNQGNYTRPRRVLKRG